MSMVVLWLLIVVIPIIRLAWDSKLGTTYLLIFPQGFEFVYPATITIGSSLAAKCLFVVCGLFRCFGWQMGLAVQ